MRSINRAGVSERPKQPYVDWTHKAHPRGPQLTVEEHAENTICYALPAKYDGKAEEAIRKYWRLLFEDTLRGWLDDESLWPQKRTFKMFHEWFYVDWHPMVMDVVPGPLEYDDEPDEDES
jgi:hypothetical protein